MSCSFQYVYIHLCTRNLCPGDMHTLYKYTPVSVLPFLYLKMCGFSNFFFFFTLAFNIKNCSARALRQAGRAMLKDKTHEYRPGNLKVGVVATSKYWLFYSSQKCICFIFSYSWCNLTAFIHELLDCNTSSYFLIVHCASKFISWHKINGVFLLFFN